MIDNNEMIAVKDYFVKSVYYTIALNRQKFNESPFESPLSKKRFG